MNFNTHLQAIWTYKIRFVVVFFVLFTLLYALFYVIDFLPEAPTETDEVDTAPEVAELSDAERAAMSDDTDRLQSVTEEELNIEIVDQTIDREPMLPTSIRIEKLDKTLQVLNPQSRSISDLDAALLNGVVRHPDSATLDQEGNVFILGHSSYLPNVLNRNFQAFNGIQNLEWGDTIELISGEKTFVYRVEKVYQAKASEVIVPIANTGSMLTIATCNSFGSLDDRYIVEASLVKTV